MGVSQSSSECWANPALWVSLAWGALSSLELGWTSLAWNCLLVRLSSQSLSALVQPFLPLGMLFPPTSEQLFFVPCPHSPG